MEEACVGQNGSMSSQFSDNIIMDGQIVIVVGGHGEEDDDDVVVVVIGVGWLEVVRDPNTKKAKRNVTIRNGNKIRSILHQFIRDIFPILAVCFLLFLYHHR